MKRIGITGQSGFIGSHLAAYVAESDGVTLIPFEDTFFEDEARLRGFVRQCDVIVHLAAASRMPSDEALYNINIGLVQQLIDAMEAESVKPLVMFSSSTHETRDTAYGKAKLEGRKLFEVWARRNGSSFVGFVFPNIYGPGARVHYASFIANFAWELQHDGRPTIMVDAPIRLLYVKNLCKFIAMRFDYVGIERIVVPFDVEIKVSEVLEIFKVFWSKGYVAAKSKFEYLRAVDIENLYSTFVSYG